MFEMGGRRDAGAQRAVSNIVPDILEALAENPSGAELRKARRFPF